MVIATLHLVGTIVVLVAVMFLSGIIDSRVSHKRLERVLDAASVKLNLPRDGVFAGEFNSEIARYLAERYDADQWLNRISDVGRPFWLAGEWLSYSAQLAIVVFAGWFAFTDDPSYAAVAWFAVLVAFLMWALIACSTALLYVLTGRVPGEAIDARALSVRLRNDRDISPTNALSGPGKADASTGRS